MWMRKKKFIETYGVPRIRLERALKSEWRNQVGFKISPEKENSPWLIDVERTLKLFKEGFI